MNGIINSRAKRDFILEVFKDALKGLLVSSLMLLYIMVTDSIYVDFMQMKVLLTTLIGLVLISGVFFCIRVSKKRNLRVFLSLVLILIFYIQYTITQDLLRFGLDIDSKPKIILVFPTAFEKYENEIEAKRLQRYLPQKLKVDDLEIEIKVLDVGFSEDFKSSYLHDYLSSRSDVIGVLALNC